MESEQAVARITVPEAIALLQAVVERLRSAYPQKRFTLDGRLVGDLGEVLCAGTYDITIVDGIQKYHDAVASDGRRVQIKATMRDSLTFPGDHVPDYYLGIKIHADGTFDEIFNGPGLIAWQAIRNRSKSKYNLHSISNGALRALSATVKPEGRIARRAGLE